jgi:ribosomal protein S18 acetylase RimI-like enzyme
MNIRLAMADDAILLADVHIRTWQAAYRGLIPDETLDSLDIAERASRWRALIAESPGDTLVAIDNGSIIGFCSIGPSRDEAGASNGIGEVTSIYVDPSYWRSGVGRALCDAAIAQAQDRAFLELILWVLEGNHRARAFYEKMGFSLDHNSDFTHGFGGNVKLPQVRYRMQLSASGTTRK